MTPSKVERLAALTDDKTMISGLIREGSDRIRLIEFKDARAEIWHYFRLVQLDGSTLPYAVCIRCMKPVSYKAREGTGGLHRHPCSKLTTAIMGTTAPINTRSDKASLSVLKVAGNPSTSQTAISPSSSSSSTTNDNSSNNNNNIRNILSNSSASPTTFQYSICLPFMRENDEMENQLGIMANDTPLEPDFDRKLIEMACSFLIPLHVISDETFSSMLTGRAVRLSRPEITSRLNYWYSSAKQTVSLLLSRQSHVTFVIDSWSEEISEKQFLTIWAYFWTSSGDYWKLILVTKDISYVQTREQIIREVDKVRENFYGLQKKYVYIFDNKLNLFWDHLNPNHLLCVCHQLYNLVSAAFVGAEIIIDHIDKVQQLCQERPKISIAEIVPTLEFQNTNWHRLQMVTVIDEHYEEVKQLLGESKFTIDKDSYSQLSSFFSLMFTAIQTLNSKDIGPTLPLVALWRAKIEDNCKLNETDCELVKVIKTNVSEALRKSQLHHNMYLMAVCLDPRFKKLKMLSSELREQTYNDLKSAVLAEAPTNQQDQRMETDKKIKSEPEEEKSSDFDFEEEYSQKRLRLSDSLPNAFTEYLDCADDDGKDELEIYLSLDVGQVPPLDFWNSEHGHRFPRLRAIANRLLSIPAIPDYCQLSPTGHDFCLKRKMVIGTHADQILFLHVFNKMHPRNY